MCLCATTVRLLLALFLGAVAVALLLPVSASALVAPAKASKVDYFAGAGCGTPSTVVLYLRRGARRIRVQSPAVGTAIRGADTGQFVARVSAIDVGTTGTGQPVVRFTATGSDDVCTNPEVYADSGWGTRDVRFAVAYRTRERVYLPSRCYNAAYKPRSVILACGDGNAWLRNMRWSAWDGRVARGRGLSYENDCIPYCAVGQFHWYPVRVVASKPKLQTCDGTRRYVYQRLRVTYTGNRPTGKPASFRWPSGCLDI
jgi:hypothetical protein